MSETEQSQEPRSSRAGVVYRHATLAEGAELRVHADRSVFVVMDEPPPVRTVVQLWRGGEARAVMVERSAEVPDPEEGVCGFFALPADEEAIAAAIRVGTEHLEAGSGSSGEGTGVEAGSDAEHNMNMAMPAPVVVHDDAEDEEPGEAAADADSGDGSESPDDGDDGDDEGEADASAESADSTETSSDGGDKPPRKRRRKRRR